MSKKTKKTPDEPQVDRDLYSLKTDAVDRLVNANKKTYTNTTADPGKQYRSKSFLDKIPAPVKAFFIKFWFNGAICYFIFWGLGMLINGLDMIVILGIVLGMANDLLVNNTLRFLAITEGANDKWMMFPKKKYWTFFANMVYSIIVLAIVIWIYSIINMGLNLINGTEGMIGLGVEPILFGIFYVAIDMLFISMKKLLIRIIEDAKENSKVK